MALSLRLMSRADITRIFRFRTVKTTKSFLPIPVFPRAPHRFSAEECLSSSTTDSGSLKKTSSHSSCETLCFPQLLALLPASHSKPSAFSNTSILCILSLYTILWCSQFKSASGNGVGSWAVGSAGFAAACVFLRSRVKPGMTLRCFATTKFRLRFAPWGQKRVSG